MEMQNKIALLEAAIAASPFTVWAGSRLDSYEEGRIAISFALRDEMKQHHGYAHGALVGYIADTACAWAAASVAGDVVTSEYKINLLSPAIGERLEAVGVVVKASKRQVVTTAEVFARTGEERKLVAIATATIAVLGDRRSRV